MDNINTTINQHAINPLIGVLDIDTFVHNYNIDIAGKQERLRAVLAYDGIDANSMHIHLAKKMNLTHTVAKRMLFGNHRTILNRGIEACKALNVCVEWLYLGRLEINNDKVIQLRTQRIHMQAYKGYPKALTDKAMRFNFAYIAGKIKARNLMNLVQTNRMSYIEAVAAY